MKIILSALAPLAFGLIFSTGCPAEPVAAAECTSNDECPEDQTCLTEFKGGYCGFKGCDEDADCPAETMCVREDGENYCFLMCEDKVECNAARTADNEANCANNIDPVDDNDSKACVPPSGN